MATDPRLQYTARNAAASAKAEVPRPRLGEAIFAGTSYPRSWDALIGQATAKEQLRAACYDAKIRQHRLDHVLLASGLHGIGKTALAKLITADLGTGLVEVQGKIDIDEGRAILLGMETNDVLFWDEFHQAVSGSKTAVEWLLPVLQDGMIISKRGVEPMPRITLVAATTDAQKLPETILSRFKVVPTLTEYSEVEGAQIATVMALRIFPDSLPQPDLATCVAVARAANCNPRMIDRLLTQLRIAAVTKWAPYTDCGFYILDKALEWAGTTEDGLDDLAQRYLTTLLKTFEGGAGERTIAAALGEPTPPRHTEKLLVRKDLLTITAKGRALTEAGVARALELLTERTDT